MFFDDGALLQVTYGDNGGGAGCGGAFVVIVGGGIKNSSFGRHSRHFSKHFMCIDLLILIITLKVHTVINPSPFSD